MATLIQVQVVIIIAFVTVLSSTQKKTKDKGRAMHRLEGHDNTVEEKWGVV